MTRNKQINITCDACTGAFEIDVNADDFEAWQHGEFAQNAFPYLSEDERELIMSGTCGPCFDVIFPEDGE